MRASETLLRLEDLTVTVTLSNGEKKTILRNITLNLHAGRCLAIVGESGSGKTTLAKTIAGLLPSSMTVSGSLTTLGLVGYMFQDAGNALNPTRRVIWQVEEALRAQGVPRARRRADALDYLARAEIPDVARYSRLYPHQLSGGLAQRVLIAAVLAANPSALIADEPTSALDVSTQARIGALLRRLVTQDNIGMMLITHDLTVAAQIGDDIAVMYQGQIVEHGAVQQVFGHPQHEYTRALVGALPKRARTIHTKQGAL
jgi:ABC-type glutathione transport system ATPase component